MSAHLSDKALDLRGRREVCGEGDDARARPFAPELVRSRVEPFPVPRDDEQSMTGAGEDAGELQSDPARCAGDESGALRLWRRAG